MKKKNLHALGLGRGSDRAGKINLVKITFEYDELVGVPELRALLVESVSYLLDLINSYPNRDEYFATLEHPEDVISIILMAEEPLHNEPEKVWSAILTLGTIRYCLRNTRPFPRDDGPMIIVHQETYQEAKLLVDNQP